MSHSSWCLPSAASNCSFASGWPSIVTKAGTSPALMQSSIGGLRASESCLRRPRTATRAASYSSAGPLRATKVAVLSMIVFMSAGGSGGDADFGDHATARAVEAALSATVHALPPALEPPRHGGELWELLRRRWCELTAPWRELIAAGTSWRELLQDLELRLDLDLGSEDDFEDREYVRGLFEAEYAEAMSYEGHD